MDTPEARHARGTRRLIRPGNPDGQGVRGAPAHGDRPVPEARARARPTRQADGPAARTSTARPRPAGVPRRDHRRSWRRFNAAADGPAAGAPGRHPDDLREPCADEALPEIAPWAGTSSWTTPASATGRSWAGRRRRAIPEARQHHARPPCSARADGAPGVFPEQIELPRGGGVFIHREFWPPAWPTTLLKALLEELGSVPAGRTGGGSLTGQIRTRLEGFFEMIGKNGP